MPYEHLQPRRRRYGMVVNEPRRAGRRRLGRRTLLLAAPAIVPAIVAGSVTVADTVSTLSPDNTRPSDTRPDDRPADDVRAEWVAFRDRFVRADGRVIDTGNAGVTHTEGQGYGLLFAEYFDDAATFDRILDWTTHTLRRPSDALHVWRYTQGDEHTTADTNNATDADLCIAWALARAAQRWRVADHAAAAAAIARDVLRLLTVRLGGKLLLLPGVTGFERPAGVVINPSYYVFPAMSQLALLAPSADWATLQADGLRLIDQGRFGTWKLPPDWLLVGKADGGLSPAPPWPPRCSFDAIRVPLFLAWAGLRVPALGAFAAFYAPRDGKPPPAWVDLRTGAEAEYPATPGMLAIARIAAVTAAGPGGAATAGPIDFPRVADAPDYYAAALILLARIASQESKAA